MSKIPEQEFDLIEKMTKADFLAYVGDNDFTIVFTKKDGSERELKGTLNMEKVPEEHRPKPKELTEEQAEAERVKKEKSPYLSVYEHGVGWRQFDPTKLIFLEVHQK